MMTAAHNLTSKQREILTTIRTVTEAQVRRIESEYPGAKASRWVSAVHLNSAFGATGFQLRMLVKKGWLEMRPSGGWGPEVRHIAFAKTDRTDLPTSESV